MRQRVRFIVVGMIVTALAVLLGVCLSSEMVEDPSSPTSVPSAAPASVPNRGTGFGDLIPEPQAIAAWINSAPITVEGLQGKVVLVDFWTYSCINCIRTLPYLKDWQNKYASRGLVILGIHSPEFKFEEDLDNVRQAIADLGVTWPVALDNEMETWRAYKNRYWPHKYLADAQGRLRYHHIGEGAYQETEKEIRKLLTQAGYDVSDIYLGQEDESLASRGSITREIYAGLSWQRGQYLGNPALGIGRASVNFVDPGGHSEGEFYLHGLWKVDQESVRLAEPVEEYGPYIAMKYLAREVHAVIQPRNSTAMRVLVTLDQAPVPRDLAGDDIVYDDQKRSYLEVQMPRMYNLVRGVNRESGELRLLPLSEDFQLYTYTFG